MTLKALADRTPETQSRINRVLAAFASKSCACAATAAAKPLPPQPIKPLLYPGGRRVEDVVGLGHCHDNGE